MRLANFWVCGRVTSLIVITAVLISACPATAQTEFAPGVCLIPIKDGAGAHVDWVPSFDGRFGRKSAARPSPPVVALHPLPLSTPVLYQRGTNQAPWTVSEDNAFKRFGGDFPDSWLFDTFVVETPNGRVLGTGAVQRQSVYALDPGSGQFYPIVTAPFKPEGGSGYLFRFIHTIARIPRLDLTLIGTDNGVFHLRGSTIEPWAGATGQDVGPVVAIEDLPVHGAVMLASYHDASLRRDDGSVEKLIDTSGGWFSRADEVTAVSESRQPGWIVAMGQRADWEIEMRPRPAGGFTPGRSRTISNDNSVRLVTRAGDYLLLKRQTWSSGYILERLESDGLRAAPGDTITGIFDTAWKRPILVESASLGVVLIHGPDRWYSYDGKRVSAISGSESEATGGFPMPTDMPSIGKTILSSSHGLFEFTADSRLIPLATPKLHGKVQALADMRSAGIGLIATTDNLYALTKSGTVQPISGAAVDAYRIEPFVGVLPGRNGMLVQGQNGLHLVLQGASCPAAQSPGVAAP